MSRLDLAPIIQLLLLGMEKRKDGHRSLMSNSQKKIICERIVGSQSMFTL